MAFARLCDPQGSLCGAGSKEPFPLAPQALQLLTAAPETWTCAPVQREKGVVGALDTLALMEGREFPVGMWAPARLCIYSVQRDGAL